MKNKKLVLPINHYIRNNPHFFNEPSLIQCFHCDNFCTKTAPIPIPINKDGKTYRVHNSKFGCNIYCAGRLSKNLSLFIDMLHDIYELEDLDELKPALEIYALQDYGGKLTKSEFYQWNLDSHSAQECEDIILANPFYSYKYNPDDELWNLNNICRFKCMHCRDPIKNNPPVPGIEQYDKERDKFILKGIYCTTACAFRALGLRKGAKCDLRLRWFSEFVRRFLSQGRQVELQRPPSRRLKLEYYGPLTSEQYHMENPVFTLVLQPPFVDYPFSGIHDTSTGFEMIDLSNRTYKSEMDLSMFKKLQSSALKLNEKKNQEEKENDTNQQKNSTISINSINSLGISDETEDLDNEEDDYYCIMSKRVYPIYHKVCINNINPKDENPFRLHVVLAVVEMPCDTYSTQDFLKQIVKQAN